MTDTAIPDEGVLGATVRAAASGDQLACARLVQDHYAPMVRAAFVIVGDAELAREAVQAAWSIAWRQLGRVRDPERIRPWLVSIAANEARRLVRRQRRRTVVEIAARADEEPPRDPAAVIDLIDLGRSLRALDARDRSLLAMRYVAGLDSYEIARAAGMSASGVRSRLARLLDRLRKELDDA